MGSSESHVEKLSIPPLSTAIITYPLRCISKSRIEHTFNLSEKYEKKLIAFDKETQDCVYVKEIKVTIELEYSIPVSLIPHVRKDIMSCNPYDEATEEIVLPGVELHILNLHGDLKWEKRGYHLVRKNAMNPVNKDRLKKINERVNIYLVSPRSVVLSGEDESFPSKEEQVEVNFRVLRIKAVGLDESNLVATFNETL